MTQEYTVEEVTKHNKAKDLWLVLHGKVYDLTTFLREHPGGEEVLINLGGQDGTQCFDDVGHSQEATQLKNGYQIGQLQGNFSFANVDTFKEIIDDDWTNDDPENDTSTHLTVFMSLGILLYAIIFYVMLS